MTFDDQVAIRTLYGECRGEPEDGQRAVAHVLRNRVADSRFGSNPAQVCLRPKQFSCWNFGDPNWLKITSIPDDDALLQKLAQIWLDTASSPDPTSGALYYYVTSMNPIPYWARSKKQPMRVTATIGHQTFLTDKV